MRFFVDYRQKDWPEWLASAEFAINNKVYLTTKVSPFIASYGREIRIEIDFRRKGKIKKVIEFAERIRKVQEEAEVTLTKVQKEIKR